MKWTEAESPSAIKKERMHPRARAPGYGLDNYLMTDGEWDNFWARRETNFPATATTLSAVCAESDDEAVVVSLLASGCGFKLAVSSGGKPSYGSRNRSSRSTRCGSCVACHAQDCGTCKNCRDKPRFGGPGIKKKACLARICRNATPARSQDARGEDPDEQEEEGEEKEEATEVTALAVDVAHAAEESFLSTIIEACKRQPLTPIRSRSCSQLDLLSNTALHAIC